MAAKVILAVTAIAVTVACAELALRAIGFSYQLYPSEIEFGAPNPTRIKSMFRLDRDLFWVSKSYFDELSRARVDRPSLVFMGDSVTAAGLYQKSFAKLAREAAEGEGVSYVNLGVGGWSSHQGLVQLVRDVVPIRPAIITVYYGWNDHWIGFGIQDKEVTWINSSIAFRLFSISRVAQLATKSFVVAQGQDGKRPLRVSPGDFRANLREIVQIARDHQITTVLLTAPTSHQIGSEPRRLLRRHIEKLEDLVPLHQQYTDIVREVAADEGAVLCDAARAFEALPVDQLREQYFLEDGIHLRGAGNAYLAKTLFDCFGRAQILDELH